MLRLRHPLALLLILLLVLAGVLRSFSTPAPVEAGAPDVRFSAERAEAVLRDILPENAPHAAGSANNVVVRDRIAAHFEAAGYTPEVQSRFHCNPAFGACSPVDNLIAVKPGAVGKHAVLLTAHYDSVWAGPGAADDGAGVAALLEIARMAAEFPPFDNDVLFLVSDAEENGLIGAHAFAGQHPSFQRVKAVINLEARGVTGPSVMFETGGGNRSVIRMLSKNVERPVANALVYEIYQRMPNDTDYSVYRQRGVMGVNFAFAGGVALYHSALDDPDHLDPGSLQHHGDNAWGMLTAFGDRDLGSIYHREDAGYIDVFATRLIHYPESIAEGLSLVLGVWVMIAIALAFRREFRYRQLRWGLLAVPLMIAAIALGGYLLSWPLGRWPDLHPLEHPLPWTGRLTLFLLVGLVLYATLKTFSGRVSPCAWMVLAWGLVFVLGVLLSSRVPVLAHNALVPLAGFAFGSLIDLFRRKSPAPLLMASLLGFAAAAYISLYHFFLLDAVANFDRSLDRVLPLTLVALVSMPMLLAYAKGRELSWRPAQWVGMAVLAGCLVHVLLPGYTADRPRDMKLMYTEVDGEPRGHLVVDSPGGRYDEDYVESHDFVPTELRNGRLGTVQRPAREVQRLDLPGVALEVESALPEGDGWRRRLELTYPKGSRFVQLSLPADIGLQSATVNGVLALDAAQRPPGKRKSDVLRLFHPPGTQATIELQTATPAAFTLAAVTWHDLPAFLTAPFMGNWPDSARPAHYPPRAEKIQRIEVPTASSR